MIWKEQLKKLELQKQWDNAITFMQQVIKEHPNDLDAYLLMNYLLMNLRVEVEHDHIKDAYYEQLLKKYFDESYAKFSQDPEYLFYTGITAVMSEWFFGIETQDWEKMLKDAIRLAPDNPVYRWSESSERTYSYAQRILTKESPIKKQLETKGSLGEYIYGMMTYWANEVIEDYLKKTS